MVASRWSVVILLVWASLVGAASPNVLLVYVDDLTHDAIGAAGNPDVKTPTIDALAARGFRFTNAYCMGGDSPAVCVPSRVMLLTGRGTFHTPDYLAKTYDGPTLGKSFRAAGYDTLCLSKPGNSFPPAHRDFETVVHIPHVGAETNRQCADAAIEFLSTREDDRPFFVYFAPSMPHDPRTAEERFHSAYPPAGIRLPRNFLRESPLDIGVRDIRDERLAASPRDPDEMRRHLADYYACVTSLDFHLGRVLDELSKPAKCFGRLGRVSPGACPRGRT